MNARFRKWRTSALAVVLALLNAACTLTDETVWFEPSPVSLNVPPATPSPAPVAQGWRVLQDGLETRTFTPYNNLLGPVVALRVDPARFTFKVHYSPNAPLLLDDWRALLGEPTLVINANFFDVNGNALGLVVSEGQPYGQSYTGRGGMFAVQSGMARVRSLVTEPYAGEALEQAVQGFPMLVLDGEAVYGTTRSDNVTRRTVIGQDSQGRIVILVTPLLGLSLTDISRFLADEPALDLVTALNLDGGGSSMLYASSGLRVDSFDAVPVVLAVYAR